MNVLVIGFSDPELRALGDALQAAGHRVLAAPHREGARAFAAAVAPDAVLVPDGPRGVAAAAWLDPTEPPRRVEAVTTPEDAVARLVAAPRSRKAPPGGRRGRRAEGGGVAAPRAPVGSEAEEARETGALEASDAPVTAPRPGDAPVDGAPAGVAFDRGVAAPAVPAGGVAVDGASGSAPVVFVATGPHDVAVEESPSRRALAPPRVLAFVPPAPDEASLGPARGPSPAPPLAEVTTPAASATARRERPVGAASPERPEVHPELATKLSQTRFADYFTLLEVEPEASTWLIREGHERLSRRFSARGWPHRLSPAELEILDEIGRALADAVLVLGDEALRARYQRALASSAQGLPQGAVAP